MNIRGYEMVIKVKWIYLLNEFLEINNEFGLYSEGIGEKIKKLEEEKIGT